MLDKEWHVVADVMQKMGVNDQAALAKGQPA
jgi:hypothetical protein